jgi:hypothetical protein
VAVWLVVGVWLVVEPCDCVAPCEGAALAGALFCGAALGAGALVFFWFWPQAKAGTAINSRITASFRNIFSLLEVRFITAS